MREKFMKEGLMIDSAFISTWHPRYDEIEGDEPEYQNLIDQIRNELNDNGSLTKSTFVRVLDWKSPRVKGIVKLNEFSVYETGIADAFRTPDSQKLGMLCQLYGIGAPVGSTLLHLMYPTVFPIIDIRTVETLQHVGLLRSPATNLTRYPAFMAAILKIASENSVFTLREIDRALFSYHKIILSPSLKRKIAGAQPTDRMLTAGRNTTNQNKGVNIARHIAMSEKLTTRDKVVNVFADKHGQIFSKKEVVDLVLQAYPYPDTKRKSIIPSDYCYNMINVDPSSFKLHGFEFIANEQYRWLGPAYPYSGPIYWKAEQVGKWENGQCDLWKDPRKRQA